MPTTVADDSTTAHGSNGSPQHPPFCAEGLPLISRSLPRDRCQRLRLRRRFDPRLCGLMDLMDDDELMSITSAMRSGRGAPTQKHAMKTPTSPPAAQCRRSRRRQHAGQTQRLAAGRGRNGLHRRPILAKQNAADEYGQFAVKTASAPMANSLNKLVELSKGAKASPCEDVPRTRQRNARPA